MGQIQVRFNLTYPLGPHTCWSRDEHVLLLSPMAQLPLHRNSEIPTLQGKRERENLRSLTDPGFRSDVWLSANPGAERGGEAVGGEGGGRNTVSEPLAPRPRRAV